PPVPSGTGTGGTPGSAPGGSGTQGSAPGGSGPAATTVLTVRPARPRRTGTASGVPVQGSLTTHSADGVLAVPGSPLLGLAGGGYGLEGVEPSGAHPLGLGATGVF